MFGYQHCLTRKFTVWQTIYEHDKTNKMNCAPSEDSDQPGWPPSLISIFTVHFLSSLGPKLSSDGQKDWSDWADSKLILVFAGGGGGGGGGHR